MLPLVAFLVVGLMASLAAPLGPLLKSMPPLHAYSTDIVCSVAGITVFALLSSMGTDPIVWFAVVAGVSGRARAGPRLAAVVQVLDRAHHELDAEAVVDQVVGRRNQIVSAS